VPDWVEPVVRYMATEGLKGTATIASESVLASLVIGVVLGTLLTIDFWPLRALIRLYVEIWRGLPLIVTIFLIFFVLPRFRQLRLGSRSGAARRSRRQREARFSRSRENSTRRPRRSAFAGSVGTSS
jgi:His/Glu/Gln/Arg/opine family amino acid ABC transporter permease subunit